VVQREWERERRTVGLIKKGERVAGCLRKQREREGETSRER
jgi:hypothetical protein